MTWTPSTPSLPPGSGRPTPTSARSTGSSPPPTPESSSATYTQTLRGDGLLGRAPAGLPAPALCAPSGRLPQPLRRAVREVVVSSPTTQVLVRGEARLEDDPELADIGAT